MKIPDTQSFDFLIIGGGLAGLQLALAFAKDDYFNNRKIGIIECHPKNQNDKTWCFWEKGKGQWEALIKHQWSHGKFVSKEKSQSLSMGDYQYKMIRSIDFYEHALAVLKSHNHIHWINEKAIEVNEFNCSTETATYRANFIFDSRLSPDFDHYTGSKVLQHFKGIHIEVDTDTFHPESFTMMDFRQSYEDQCCFTYVLPFSKRSALVEFTFFSPELVSEETYDQLIAAYLKNHLKVQNFKTLDSEMGVIPMSDFHFTKDNTSHYVKIGTAGGWVKSSSGYSFKSAEKKVAQIIRNIKSHKNLDHKLFNRRFQFYDRFFLRVLHEENQLGNQLFKEMYLKNKTYRIFEFLDEESNLINEFKLINRFTKAPFLRSLKKEIM